MEKGGNNDRILCCRFISESWACGEGTDRAAEVAQVRSPGCHWRCQGKLPLLISPVVQLCFCGWVGMAGRHPVRQGKARRVWALSCFISLHLLVKWGKGSSAAEEGSVIFLDRNWNIYDCKPALYTLHANCRVWKLKASSGWLSMAVTSACPDALVCSAAAAQAGLSNLQCFEMPCKHWAGFFLMFCGCCS